MSAQLELYGRVCNQWWRAYMIPSNTMGCFIFLLAPIYLALTSYDSDLPIYIYASFPAMGITTLCCTVCVNAEFALINIRSTEILKILCSSTPPSTARHQVNSRSSAQTSDPDQLFIVTQKHPKAAQYHGVTVFSMRTRHILYPMRPIRIELGTFGQYVKLGAGAKIISEVFTYLIILLRLRELRSLQL